MEKNTSDVTSNSNFLYDEIKASIKGMIKSKGMHAGAKIPNESELCKMFDVSRITIRRAIKELIEENVIEVVRGKGTFVKASITELHILNLKGFTEGLSTEERNIEKQIISKKLINDEDKISKKFQYMYTKFIELVRLVSDEDGKLSLDYAYLPTELYPEIEKKIENETSTFRLIREEYHVRFAKVKKEVEYLHPTPTVCEHLGVSRVSPVILVEKIIYDKFNKPLHYSKYYLVAERVKLLIEAEYTD